MINHQYMKYGVLSTALLISTIMLTAPTSNQNLIFAQAQNYSETLTFAIPLDDSYSTDQSSSTPNSVNNDNFPFGLNSDSSGTDTSIEEPGVTTSDKLDDAAPTDKQSDEQEYEETNPLVGDIKAKISKALSASGLPVQ